MRRENLIILKYADNNAYTTVVKLVGYKDKYFSIDITHGNWVYDGKTYNIGEPRYCEWGCHWGVIGVYDRTNITHLNRMISLSKEATAEPHYSDD
jgi:hypothetical protein